MKEPSDSESATEALMVRFFRCSRGLIPSLMTVRIVEGGLQCTLCRFKSHRHSIAGEWRNHAGGISDRKGRPRLGSETESRHSAEAGGVDVRGLKAVGESVAEPLRYFRVNLGTTLALAETMAAHDVTRLVFSSSATVYSPAAEVPLQEDADLKSRTTQHRNDKRSIDLSRKMDAITKRGNITS